MATTVEAEGRAWEPERPPVLDDVGRQGPAAMLGIVGPDSSKTRTGSACCAGPTELM
jgi:hypothetical protein